MKAQRQRFPGTFKDLKEVQLAGLEPQARERDKRRMAREGGAGLRSHRALNAKATCTVSPGGEPREGLEGESALPAAVWQVAWKQRAHQDCPAVSGDTWAGVVTVQLHWKGTGLRTLCGQEGPGPGDCSDGVEGWGRGESRIAQSIPA